MAEELEQEVNESASNKPVAARISGIVNNFPEYFEENKQKVLGIGGVLVVLIVGVLFLYAKFLPERDLAGKKAMYMAEIYFGMDSFDVALNGNAAFKGFAQISKDYSWTKSANLANYYSGICCLNTKKFEDAIKYLEKFSTSDPIIGAARLNALGDAYAETGKLDDAVKYYEKAGYFSDNEQYAPYYLLKAGMLAEKLNKADNAAKFYERIKEKYPQSEEGRDIEKYIARATAK
jgi:tetratricopeptide (TPR) repeat protein